MAVDGLNLSDINMIRLSCKRIAVVGISPKAHRASHQVALFLRDKGYQVIPVNPAYDEVLGMVCYPSLADIPEKVDMVDCFRASEAMPALVDEVIAVGAKVMWMQLGIVNHEVAKKARDAGIQVVMNRCPKIEFPQLERLYS